MGHETHQTMELVEDVQDCNMPRAVVELYRRESKFVKLGLLDSDCPNCYKYEIMLPRSPVYRGRTHLSREGRLYCPTNR